MKACEDVKKDCDSKLDVRKKEFNEMKRAMEIINQKEQELKDECDKITITREKHKQKCDQIKTAIK